MKKVLFLACIILFPGLLSADTIKLKSGATVEGQILQNTDEYVKIDVQGVELTYYRDEIADNAKEASGGVTSLLSDPSSGRRLQKVFDKLVWKASDLKNTEVPKEAVLKDVRGKAAQQKNMSFEYESETFSGEGRDDVEKGNVFIKDDNTWREETGSEYGGKGFKIRNGDDLWEVETVKFVQKRHKPSVFDRTPTLAPVFTNWNNQEAISFNIFSINPVKVGGLQYKGEQEVDGEPCYVLEEDRDFSQVIFWIAKNSGTLRKYLMVENSAADPQNAALQTKTSWTVNVRRVGFVKQVKWDQQFDESLFRYVLKEGDQVEEESEVNGETVKKKWIVPYKGAVLSGQEMSQRNEKLDEVTKKFNEVKGFTCRYQYHEKDEKGVRVGLPVKPGENPSANEGKYITPEKTQSGILKLKKPSKLSYVYDVKSNIDYENVTGCFVMTDGEEFWDYSTPFRVSPNSTSEKSVIKQKVKDIRSLHADILQSAEKSRERGQRFQEPGEPGLIVPPEMESYELVSGSFSVKIPAYSLEPFKNLNRDSIVYQGKETLRGEETYRFLVKESKEHRKSMHWIGVNDGIPRQVDEYDWVGDLVARQMVLSDVKVNPDLKDDDFVFKNDGTFKIQDMSHMMPDIKKALKQSFDTPPEDTFAMNFDMPVGKVKNLKGSGMFFRGGEAFIRFNCSEAVTLKNSKEYSESPQDIAEIADYFRKSFPEDEEALKNLDELTLKKYVTKAKPGAHAEEGRILLENKGRNTYFFRMWFWAD